MTLKAWYWTYLIYLTLYYISLILLVMKELLWLPRRFRHFKMGTFKIETNSQKMLNTLPLWKYHYKLGEGLKSLNIWIKYNYPVKWWSHWLEIFLSRRYLQQPLVNIWKWCCNCQIVKGSYQGWDNKRNEFIVWFKNMLL